MFKKKSFVVVLLISFWLGYTLLSIVQTMYTSVKAKDRIETYRNQNIDFILDSSKSFILSDNMDLLKEQMQSAVNLKFIDYFCVSNKGQIIDEYSPNPGASACDALHAVSFEKYDVFYKLSKRVIKPIKIDDYEMVVGYNSDLIHFLLWEHRENFIPFIKDILIITLFVGILIFLILKDFVMIDQLLKKGDKLKLSKIRAASKEAQTLIDSTTTMDTINTKNKHSIHLLQNTVGEALASEIRNETESLTTIPVSVVRIDLNGYTQIFLEKKEEHIVSVLNEYFEVTNDIINRYQGEIYQIIGDEIIFIFKSSKYLTNRNANSVSESSMSENASQNTQQTSALSHATINSNAELEPNLKALFCVKAIFEWSKKLDKKINDQFGHRFLLKSSISNGHLKFVKLNTGFAFAGVPLIESVRLLGSVSDKSENTLIVIENDYQDFQNFFPISNQKLTHLKGFEEKVTVFEIKEFIPVDEYFTKAIALEDNELMRVKMKYLDYFKSQDDIIQSLVLINKYFLANNLTPIFYLIQSLKKSSLLISDALISQRLYQILVDHFQQIQSRALEYSFLPGMILLIKNLVHKDLWNAQWNQLLQNYLLSTNPRIVANASDVFYFYHDKIDEIKNILTNWQDNNRISALYILALLKRDITKKEADMVLTWLSSDNPLFQASALYLIEELVRYYSEKDEVVYNTNEVISKFKDEGLRLLSSYNQMVQSRAEMLLATVHTVNQKFIGKKVS
jgi:adenylate cyclase